MLVVGSGGGLWAGCGGLRWVVGALQKRRYIKRILDTADYLLQNRGLEAFEVAKMTAHQNHLDTADYLLQA